VILGYDPSQVTGGAQVTVLTGTQFAVNAPTTGSTSTSAPTSPTTAGAGGSSGSTSGASVGFAAPSPTTQPLQPWDPRACPAGSTPTTPVPNPLPG
jgi:hypothetical protein